MQAKIHVYLTFFFFLCQGRVPVRHGKDWDKDVRKCTHIVQRSAYTDMYTKNLRKGGTNMSNSKAAPQGPPNCPAPGGPDLDDLIFQDESWLANDR